MSADPSTELLDANAEPDEPTDTRAILKKGDVIQIDGHSFTLAMNAVIEGKRGDMLTVGLKPE